MGGVQLPQDYKATIRRQFTFYHSAPRRSWYQLNRPWKGERLSLPWSQPVVLNSGPVDWESSTLTTRRLLLCSIAPLLQLKHFFWSTIGVHYMADKKYKTCLGKLCFEGQLQTHSFLVELIFILLSLISPGDSLITCELDYMLLF